MFGKRTSAALNNDYVGISLTEKGVALAVVSRPNNEKPSLRYAVNAECSSIEAVANQINLWTKQYQLKGYATNFSLGMHMYSFVLTDAPDVKSEELVNAMRWKAKELFQVELEDVVIDAIAIPGQKERGRAPMAYVVCAAIDVLKAYVKILNDSQLKIVSIDIPPLVLRNVAHMVNEEKNGIALISFFEKKGIINLCRDGELYLSRDLDIGWNDIQEAVNGELNTQAINNMVLEIQRSMDYYESRFAQPSIRHLVFSPLPESRPKFLEYLRSVTGMQVHELEITSLIGSSLSLPMQEQSTCLSAIGAALRWPTAA